MSQTTPRVSYLPGSNPGLRWLARQLAWEQTLSDLREPTEAAVHGDDTAAA
jgi:hypothetical protein